MKKRIIIIVVFLIVLFIGIILCVLATNKTFFKNNYIGVDGEEIFIPKYCFFKRETGMTVACFDSLRSKESLQKEIDEYMKDFEYFENENTYGYRKDNLMIQEYHVSEDLLIRRIYITYALI